MLRIVLHWHRIIIVNIITTINIMLVLIQFQSAKMDIRLCLEQSRHVMRMFIISNCINLMAQTKWLIQFNARSIAKIAYCHQPIAWYVQVMYLLHNGVTRMENAMMQVRIQHRIFLRMAQILRCMHNGNLMCLLCNWLPKMRMKTHNRIQSIYNIMLVGLLMQI